LRDRSATRALVLGLLALPFGILSPFAIWTGARSWRRINGSDGKLTGSGAALLGLAGGLIGALFLVAGVLLWLVVSS
jgi:hypothetical protein